MPRLSIDYHVTDYGHKSRDNQLSLAEQHSEAGRIRAEHLGGLCMLFRALDLTRLFGNPDGDYRHNLSQSDLDEVARHLNAVGQLGAYLADGLYCDVSELGDAHDSLTTFMEEDEEVAE